MADIVKANDNEFLDQLTMFYTVINADPAAYGFTQAEVDAYKAKRDTFAASLGDYDTKNTAARAARQTKDADRDPVEDEFRWMAGQFTKRKNTTNADRINAGLPPKSESVGSIVADLNNAPLMVVEQAGVHEHRVRFFMASENSTSTKKPQGVDFAKLYQKIGGDASTNLKEYSLMTEDRKSPYNWTHEPEDAGKTAHYIAVWGTDEGEQSPQSEVFSLTIT